MCDTVPLLAIAIYYWKYLLNMYIVTCSPPPFALGRKESPFCFSGRHFLSLTPITLSPWGPFMGVLFRSRAPLCILLHLLHASFTRSGYTILLI